MNMPEFHLSPERVEFLQKFPKYGDNESDISPYVLNTMAIYSVRAVEHIATNRPDVAIACDRGGRLFGLAVRRMWLELMEEPFPTVDNSLHFAKLSSREIDYRDRRDITEYRVKDRIDRALAAGKKNNREPKNARPNVLFIDDCVGFGDTYNLATKGMAYSLQYNPAFLVMEANSFHKHPGIAEGYRNDMEKIGDTINITDPINVGVDFDDGHRLVSVPKSESSVGRTRRELAKAVQRIARHVSIEE